MILDDCYCFFSREKGLNSILSKYGLNRFVETSLFKYCLFSFKFGIMKYLRCMIKRNKNGTYFLTLRSLILSICWQLKYNRI